MKQTMKRMYGVIALTAVVSGITGAFAFTLVDNSVGLTNSIVSNSNKQEDGDVPFMTLASNNTSTSQGQQYVDLTSAADKACNAVVYIKVTTNGQTVVQEYYDPFADFFGDFFGRGNGGTQRRQIQTPKRQGAGSGVIISSDGYIVTNNHVVAGADDIEVTLNDNREFKATVVGLDESTDLALIKIDASDLPTLVIGDSDNLKVGEWVLAVGNPFNLKSTVTAGIVSAKARKISESGKGNDIESYIQTDAAINAGNSGGALVNANGELVGINAALYSQTGSFTGYGFAIPTSIMKKVVTDLKQYGAVQRALIGVSGSDLSAYIDSQKAKDEKFDKDFGTTEGVYVAEVTENGAAKEAGIKEGDVIVSVNDKKITKMSELQETITRYSPGDKVKIGLLREKKQKTVEVTLKNNNGNTKVVKAQNLSALDAEFKEITADQKKSLNLQNGVQITSLDDNSPLRKMGIGKDFIIILANNTKITSVADLERVYRSALESESKTLFIWGKYPSGRTGSYAIELE